MALYDVWVMGFSPDAGDPVPGLMRTFRLEEQKARELEQTVPRIVKRRVPRPKGEKIARALRKLGADVMVRPARHSQSMMAAVGAAPPVPEARAPAMSVLAPEESLAPGVSGAPHDSMAPARSLGPGTSLQPEDSMAPPASAPPAREVGPPPAASFQRAAGRTGLVPSEIPSDLTDDERVPPASVFPVDEAPPSSGEPAEYIPPEESSPHLPPPPNAQLRRRQAATRIAGSAAAAATRREPVETGRREAGRREEVEAGRRETAALRSDVAAAGRSDVAAAGRRDVAAARREIEPPVAGPDTWELAPTPRPSPPPTPTPPPAHAPIELDRPARPVREAPSASLTTDVAAAGPDAGRGVAAGQPPESFTPEVDLDGPIRTPRAATPASPSLRPVSPEGRGGLGVVGSHAPLGPGADGPASPARTAPPPGRGLPWLAPALLVGVGLGFTALRWWRGTSIFFGNAGWLFGVWLDASLVAATVVGGLRLLGVVFGTADDTWELRNARPVSFVAFAGAMIMNLWGPFEPRGQLRGLGGTVDQRIAALEGKAEACLDTARTDGACADCCDGDYEVDEGECLCDVPFRCLEGNREIAACRACCQAQLGRSARGMLFTSEQGCICDADRSLIE
ncbi:MAG: hypothetical protein AAF715_17865 [Myxococcota bacterium]